jgi:hypothetical protein
MSLPAISPSPQTIPKSQSRAAHGPAISRASRLPILRPPIGRV